MPATFVRTLTVRSREEGASEVARALHGVSDAYKTVVRTTSDGARVIDMTASKLARTEDGWNRLTGRLEGNNSAMRAFVRESTLAKQALDQGLTSVQRYSDVIQQLRHELQAAGTTKLGFAVDQSGINGLLGVRASLTKSARESASVFEEEARLMDGLQVKASRLRAELDPLGAAYERMNAEIAEHQKLADRQLISQDELAQATGRSRDAFDKTAASLKPVNDNVKLSAFQVQNLGYQINDVGTMLASGASPFQVIATQSGQVVQALQDGPGGIRGSLKAIGVSILSFARSLGPAGIALGGLGLAAGAFALIVRRDVKPLDDIIKAQAASVKELRDAYGLAGAAAEDYAKRTPRAVRQGADDATKTSLERAAQEVNERISSQFSGRDNYRFRAQNRFSALRDAFLELKQSVADGAPAFTKFEDALAGVRANTSDEEVRDVAKANAEWARTLIPLQQELAGTSKAIDEASTKVGQMASAFRASMDVLAGFSGDSRSQAQQIEDALTSASDAAQSYGEIMAANAMRDRGLTELSRDAVNQAKEAQNALANLNLSPDQRGIAEIRQRYDAEIAELARVNGSEEALAAKRQERDAAVQAASTEASRTEAARRKGYELDLRAVTARTAAEKAAIEAERTRADLLAQGYSAPEASSRAEEARNLSLAQSNHELAEAIRQRKEAGQDQVDQAQFEMSVVGKSAAETAKLRFEFDGLAEAKRAARDAGTVVDQDEIDRIKDQAAAIGEATAALEKMNFQRDLVFRLQQAGRSDQDQRIADQLRGAGIDFDSAEGQARAQQLRYVESVEKTSEALRDMRDAGKDAFSDLIDAISQGDNAFDALISSFSGFGRKLASAGFDKLFGGLFGTANSAGSSAGIGAMPSIASIAVKAANVVAGSAGAGGAAAAINTNFSLSARSLPANADLASSIRWASQQLGTSARDLATVISYETGGTFSTSIKGGAGGKYLGLIQFGPEEQKKYGATIGQGIADQMQSVVSYLQDRGFKQGMGLLDLYSTINAGRPGRYNASDAANGGAPGTVADKVNYQMGGHQRNADRILGTANDYYVRKGVADGTIDAAKKMASGAVPIPSARPANGGASPWASLGGSQQFGVGLQALGAGLGIFSQGAQSQSPIGGALGGIMGGFEAGSTLGPLLGITAGAGPIGAVVGGIIGLVGGIFGKSKAKKQAKKQKRDQARQAWDQNKTALRELQDKVTENIRGSLEQDFLSVDENIAQFAALAKETKRKEDTATVSKLQKDAQGYKARAKELFRNTFAPVTEDLAKGLGLDSEFSKARDAVKKTAEAYRGFIGDVELAFEAPLARRDQIMQSYESAKAAIEKAQKTVVEKNYDTNGKPLGTSTVIPGIGAADAAVKLTDAAKKRDEALAEYQRLYGDVLMNREEAIRKATEAAREGLLRIVSGDVVEQTDVEKALDQSRGAAASLTVQLTKLGMTAEEAGVAIDKALSDRLARLKKDFEANLTSQINDLEGKGYLDDFKDLLKERDDLMADAGRIGADASLVTKYFGLAAQDLVDNAEISGDAFDELVAKFPELVGVIKQASGAIDELNKSAAADAVATAQSALESAYGRQSSELEATIERLKDFKDELADLRASLKLDDALSTLSPFQRMMEAQQQFRDLSTKAASGDEDAQGKLANAASEYLNEAKGYYATSEQYVAIFNEVQTSLQKSEAAAGRQLSEAQRQLQTLKDQVKYLMSIDDGIQTVAEAIAALRTAQSTAAMANGGTTWTGGKVTAADPKYGWNIPKNVGIDQGLKDLGLNFTGNYGTGQLATYVGNLPTAIRDKAQGVIDYYSKLYPKAPGYASGGIVANGIWNRDSVMAQLAGGEHVTRATMVNPRTLPVLDAINRTGIVPANRNEAARMEGIERRLDRLTAVVAEGLMRNVEATERGNASSREAATEAKRRNAA